MSKSRMELAERLKTLRRDVNEVNLTDIEKETGIPKSVIQRLENEKDTTRVNYQDVSALAIYYGVSTDYLFGLTNNLQHRHIEVDKLKLTDEAIEALASDKFNNMLASELLAHPHFPDLMAALEVFIDRTLSENMKIVNASYKVALDKLNAEPVTATRDEYIATLKEAEIDPDDYLRYRLSQRFDKLAQSLYESHEKEAQSKIGQGYLDELNKKVEKYQDVKDETDSTPEAAYAVLVELLMIDIKRVTPQERNAMISWLKRSKEARRMLRLKK